MDGTQWQRYKPFLCIQSRGPRHFIKDPFDYSALPSPWSLATFVPFTAHYWVTIKAVILVMLLHPDGLRPLVWHVVCATGEVELVEKAV